MDKHDESYPILTRGETKGGIRDWISLDSGWTAEYAYCRFFRPGEVNI